LIACTVAYPAVAQSAVPDSPAGSPSAPAGSAAAEPNAPSPQPAVAQPAPAAQTQRDKAEQQLRTEEKQRIIGIVPNFNTSYDWNAPPLSRSQKFRLAFRSAIDPATFAVAGLDAGWSMGQNSYRAYGEGVEGYSKYFAASYADSFDGAMIGNALFPALLKQDPRYFRMGESHTFKRRFLYSIASTVWCRNDNGKWGPNYSNVFGNLAAGGISNLYYPAAGRGAGLTIERGMTVTAEGTLGALFDEFWPNIAPKILKGPLSGLQKGLPPITPPAPG
jgi:hypothetical protein